MSSQKTIKDLRKEKQKLMNKAIKSMYESIIENPDILKPDVSVFAVREYYKLYRNAPDQGLKAGFAERLADILLRFRVVCSDYRFYKILRQAGIARKFAIYLMAFRLDFEPGKEKCHG
jgi:hypothetical protein